MTDTNAGPVLPEQTKISANFRGEGGGVKTHVLYRLNMHGKKCVAPFINGWNEADITVKEWTPAVQQAVLHPYELGIIHTKKQMPECIRDIRLFVPKQGLWEVEETSK